MRITRRGLLAIAPAALLTACAVPGQDDDSPDESLANGPLTLVQRERDVAGTPLGLVHLRLDPATDGHNTISLWTTDFQGTDTTHTLHARALNLLDGTTIDDIPLTVGDAGLTASVTLDPPGWWQFDVLVGRDGTTTETPFYALLPDPNIHGTDTAPSPDETSDARDRFDRAIATMQAAPHLVWHETINTGDDTMVAIDFTQVAATETAPQAVEQFLRYSATFAERADGPPPLEPRTDSYHAITIGDEGWLLTADGTAASAPPTRYAPITEWGSIYTAAEDIATGVETALSGVDEATQVIAFYSPEINGQAQAWFAWWVGASTGRVHRIAMLARAHYMTWDYTGFDTPTIIARPSTPSASPVATEG